MDQWINRQLKMCVFLQLSEIVGVKLYYSTHSISHKQNPIYIILASIEIVSKISEENAMNFPCEMSCEYILQVSKAMQIVGEYQHCGDQIVATEFTKQQKVFNLPRPMSNQSCVKMNFALYKMIRRRQHRILFRLDKNWYWNQFSHFSLEMYQVDLIEQ